MGMTLETASGTPGTPESLKGRICEYWGGGGMLLALVGTLDWA